MTHLPVLVLGNYWEGSIVCHKPQAKQDLRLKGELYAGRISKGDLKAQELLRKNEAERLKVVEQVSLISIVDMDRFHRCCRSSVVYNFLVLYEVHCVMLVGSCLMACCVFRFVEVLSNISGALVHILSIHMISELGL